MGKKLKWILFAMVAVEIALLVTGVLPAEWTVVVVALTEGTALVLTLGVFVPRAYAVSRRMKQGTFISAAVRDEFEEIIPAPLLRLASNEIGMFTSIARFVRQKIDVPVNSVVISYGGSFRTMGFALMAFTPIEVVLIDAICRKLIPGAAYIRILLIALSIYACIWIAGMLLSTRVFPHYVDEEKLVIRYGHMHRIDIPLSCIKAIEKVKKDCEGLRIVYYDGEMLVLNNGMRECELRLEIESAALITVDKACCNEGTHYVSFGVDDPSSTRKAIGERLLCAC